MQLYGLKNCDTCRKASKALPDADLLDVRRDGVPPALLRKAFEVFGADLVNTRSATWRGLDDAQRSAPPLDLLTAHPTLMKRPLIVVGDTLYLRFATVNISAGSDRQLSAYLADFGGRHAAFVSEAAKPVEIEN